MGIITAVRRPRHHDTETYALVLCMRAAEVGNECEERMSRPSRSLDVDVNLCTSAVGLADDGNDCTSAGIALDGCYTFLGECAQLPALVLVIVLGITLLVADDDQQIDAIHCEAVAAGSHGIIDGGGGVAQVEGNVLEVGAEARVERGGAWAVVDAEDEGVCLEQGLADDDAERSEGVCDDCDAIGEVEGTGAGDDGHCPSAYCSAASDVSCLEDVQGSLWLDGFEYRAIWKKQSSRSVAVSCLCSIMLAGLAGSEVGCAPGLPEVWRGGVALAYRDTGTGGNAGGEM